MANAEFHPQFNALLQSFLRHASRFLIRDRNANADARYGNRPVTLDKNLAVNASVSRAQDGYAHYTITAGAIAALMDVSASLSATEGFFPELPITGVVHETRTIYDSSHFLEYYELAGKHGMAIPLIPLRAVFNDPVRDALRGVLFDLTCRFLMLHEQMHFIRGHLHYLYGKDAPTAFDEIPATPQKIVSSAKRRALELDADGSAFMTLITSFEDRDVVLGPFGKNITNQWEWTRIVSVSALSVMILFSVADESLGESSDRSHPSPQARMLNVLDALSAHLADQTERAPEMERVKLFKDVATIAQLMRVLPPSADAFWEWQTTDRTALTHQVCQELKDDREQFLSILPNLR